jgi:protein-tyrosine sulfotransferase
MASDPARHLASGHDDTLSQARPGSTGDDPSVAPGRSGLGGELHGVLSYLRVRQVWRYVGRGLGWPTARAEDFLEPLGMAEAERLRTIAAAVRGPSPPAAIFIHGVLPRSGTNFLADALALHPDVHAHPARLWEFPLLYVAPGAAALQQEFLFMFERNREVMGRYDLLAYLASGWLAALQKEAGAKRMLFKSPHVQNLGLFRHVFPEDILLLCLRDGRDVIQSSLQTFRRWRPRGKGFAELAREWRHGTEAMLTFQAGAENAYPKAMVVRYEDLAQQPEGTMRAVLEHTGLDPATYDFAALERLPVRGSSAIGGGGDARWGPHDKPAHFQPIGRWQSAWSSVQKNRFKAIAGAALIRAGYAADARW